MHYNSQTINNQQIALYSNNETIITLNNFLDILVNAPAGTIAINREQLDCQFFDLKTRIAGEMLQKVSNYQKRLIILGDFTDILSNSFHDFICESNKSGTIIFTDTLEKGVALLRK